MKSKQQYALNRAAPLPYNPAMSDRDTHKVSNVD
jgi:hypothetical protein